MCVGALRLLGSPGAMFLVVVSCQLWVLGTELVSSGRHPSNPKNLLVCVYSLIYYVLTSLHTVPVPPPIPLSLLFLLGGRQAAYNKTRHKPLYQGWTRGFSRRGVWDIWSSLTGSTHTHSSRFSPAFTGSLVYSFILHARKEPNGMSQEPQYFITLLHSLFRDVNYHC